MKEDEALERKLRKDKEKEVNGGLAAVTGSMEELKLKGDMSVPTPMPRLCPRRRRSKSRLCGYRTSWIRIPTRIVGSAS